MLIVLFKDNLSNNNLNSRINGVKFNKNINLKFKAFTPLLSNATAFV
jgi:hypothetical protein